MVKSINGLFCSTIEFLCSHFSLSTTFPSPFFPKVHDGFIHLQNWASLDQYPVAKKSRKMARQQVIAKSLLVKTKLCWFHQHHPQGCPRQSSQCPYAHELEELKQRPDFTTVLNGPILSGLRII